MRMKFFGSLSCVLLLAVFMMLSGCMMPPPGASQAQIDQANAHNQGLLTGAALGAVGGLVTGKILENNRSRERVYVAPGRPVYRVYRHQYRYRRW